jgi:TseV toxin immunity protein TsiV
MRERLPTLRVRAPNGFPLARDGIILCFFMRRSHAEVGPAVWRALQTYLHAIPPHTLSWYITSEGGILPLDEESWKQTREDILEPCRVSRSAHLHEQHDGTSGYNFEYQGRQLDAPIFARDENSTCAVLFTLPTEYLVEHGPARVRALALELARELPFSFGYASFALLVHKLEWYVARDTVRELRDRYQGLDVYNLELTSRSIGTHARGAYWLTFLGQPLLSQLGGPASVRQRLALPDVSVEPLDDERLLLTLGEWPEAIDTQHERPPPQLLALGQLLKPFLYEEKVTAWFFSDSTPDTEETWEDMRRWIHRFCP